MRTSGLFPILPTPNGLTLKCVTVCLLAWISTCSTAHCFEEPIQNAGLTEITPGKVTSTISFLASDELAGRAIGTPEFNIASAYVASRFRGAGLEGWAEGQYYQELSTNPEKPLRNTIGILRGTDPELSKEAVIFSAHLDHLGQKPNVGDGVFNGADDNASGVTAVLLLADAFGASPRPKRTVIFIAFGGEESGLLGSKEFVKQPFWPLDKITAMVNIEMIGRPEPGANGKIWMTGWRESNLGSLMNDASQPKGVEIFEHPRFSSMLYKASDNWPLSEKGVVAHSFSAGSLHSDYHQPDDEWERLEIQHMTRVIKGLFEATQPLVEGLVTPTKKQK